MASNWLGLDQPDQSYIMRDQGDPQPTTPMGIPTGVADPVIAQKLISLARPRKFQMQDVPLQEPDRTAAQQLMDYINDPDIQAQKKSIIDQQAQGLQEQKDNVAKLEKQGPGINWAPLAALTDSWTGSHLSQGMPKVDTDAAFQEKIAALKNQIQSQQGTLTSDQLKALQNQSSLMALAKLQQGDQRIGQGNQRLNLRGDVVAAGAVDSVNKDATNEGMAKSLQRINTDSKTLSGQLPITPQTINEIEAGIALVQSGGGIASDSAREAMHIPQALDAISNIRQRYGDTVVDLRNLEPDKINQLRETLARLNASISQAQLQRSQQLMTGKAYNNIPQAKQALSALGTQQTNQAQTAKENLLSGDDLSAYKHAQGLPANDPMAQAIKSKLKGKYGFDF